MLGLLGLRSVLCHMDFMGPSGLSGLLCIKGLSGLLGLPGLFGFMGLMAYWVFCYINFETPVT